MREKESPKERMPYLSFYSAHMNQASGLLLFNPLRYWDMGNTQFEARSSIF